MSGRKSKIYISKNIECRKCMKWSRHELKAIFIVSEWFQQNNISEGLFFYWMLKIKNNTVEEMKSENEIIQVPINVRKIQRERRKRLSWTTKIWSWGYTSVQSQPTSWKSYERWNHVETGRKQEIDVYLQWVRWHEKRIEGFVSIVQIKYGTQIEDESLLFCGRKADRCFQDEWNMNFLLFAVTGNLFLCYDYKLWIVTKNLINGLNSFRITSLIKRLSFGICSSPCSERRSFW